MKRSRIFSCLALGALLLFCLMGADDCDGNNPPQLTEIDDINMIAGTTLEFQLEAVDPDGDDITFYAETLPSGAVLNPNTGEFVWTPSLWYLGVVEITFGATDGDELDEITVNIHVDADQDFEDIVIVPDVKDMVVGETFRFVANGIRTGGEVVEDIYVNWESEDELIVEVGFNGSALAVADGNVDLRAWLGLELEAFVNVDVSSE